MFPETDEISNIISDTIKVVFKRRLVDRVLRLCTQLARGQGFPRRDQIEPSKLGIDWTNCLVIAVRWEMRLISILCPDEERIEQGSDSARNKWTHPPFDTERFARNIE